MSSARAGRTATLLTNNMGVTGGGLCTPNHALDTAESYDPNFDTFTAPTTFPGARFNHTANLLHCPARTNGLDGAVLLAGGNNGLRADCERLYTVSSRACSVGFDHIQVVF